MSQWLNANSNKQSSLDTEYIAVWKPCSFILRSGKQGEVKYWVSVSGGHTQYRSCSIWAVTASCQHFCIYIIYYTLWYWLCTSIRDRDLQNGDSLPQNRHRQDECEHHCRLVDGCVGWYTGGEEWTLTNLLHLHSWFYKNATQQGEMIAQLRHNG